MICKELKHLGENIFGFRKRQSLSKIDNDDTNPLTESLFKDPMKSSFESLKSSKEEFSERRVIIGDHKVANEDSTNSSVDSTQIPKLNKFPEKKTSFFSSKKQYLSANGEEFQEDWSFTWYDFDGRGKITRKDMAIMMKSLYDIIRHNKKNSNSRSINHYKLHLVLMTEDCPNVQGLDLATSYEPIYHMDSVLTSFTNLSVGSSECDDHDSDDTIGNINVNKNKYSNRKSFSGRCFEELNEMRARKKEKRSKSTPTNNKLLDKMEENQSNISTRKKDQYSISTSLMSLAGSSTSLQINRQKSKKPKIKLFKSKANRKISKNQNDLFANKTLSSSCQNIASNVLTATKLLNKHVSRTTKNKHSKIRNKQQKRKDLGRKQVEDWLKHDIQKEDKIENEVKFIHHHHYHHHHPSSIDNMIPVQLRNSFLNKRPELEWKERPLQELHHHIHLHHYHHHYFY